MKRSRLGLLLLLALPSLAAQAAFVREAGPYVLEPNVTLRDETWLQARTITLLGDAEDDLFLMSELGMSMAITNDIATIRLNGRAQGDVWALGDTVELAGTAQSHARLLGLRTVHVTGRVGRNLMALANAVHLDASSTVDGDVHAVAGDIIAEGHVGRGLSLQARKVVLGGTVDGDVRITATDITVLPGTVIGGNLSYAGVEDLVLDPRVKVGGKVAHIAEPAQPRSSAFSLDEIMLQAGLFMGALLAGLLFFGLLPTFAFHSVDRLGQSLWRSMLVGFGACALIPMAAVLLMLTIVGIPLGIMLLLVYGLLLYFAKTVSAFFLAHRLLRRLNPSAPVTLMPLLGLGLLLIYVIVNLPFPLGTLAWAVITLIGVGGMVGAVMDRRVRMLAVAPSDATPPQPPPLPPR